MKDKMMAKRVDTRAICRVSRRPQRVRSESTSQEGKTARQNGKITEVVEVPTESFNGGQGTDRPGEKK